MYKLYDILVINSRAKEIIGLKKFIGKEFFVSNVSLGLGYYLTPLNENEFICSIHLYSNEEDVVDKIGELTKSQISKSKKVFSWNEDDIEIKNDDIESLPRKKSKFDYYAGLHLNMIDPDYSNQINPFIKSYSKRKSKHPLTNQFLNDKDYYNTINRKS